MNTAPPGGPDNPVTRLDLGGDWTCRAGSGPVPPALVDQLAEGIPGSVPGVVHLDLLAAGLVPDPYEGTNERELTWIGRTDWVYSRSFEWSGDGHSRHELVALGLDTVATIWLNDHEVGSSANHHRTHRFDVGHLLVEGTNHLRIRFTAAVTYAEEREQVLGARPHSNTHPFNCIRKPAYSFRWDWGPELVTAGIWQPLHLEGSSAARLAETRPVTGWSPDGGPVLDLQVALAHADEAHTVRVTVDDLASAEASVTTTGQLSLRVPQALPWWPRSHGDQPLYGLRVELLDPSGALVDEWSTRVGFRSVTVDTSPDADGNRFQIAVNGVPVYVRGANWIPADTFLPRVDRGVLATALQDAVEANMNLLRVWGGGIYESDDFYDLCDELGLLVWQDFTLACAAYSEDAELWQEFGAEARESITRLSPHPSLTLWNGGNENIWGWADWGWRARLAGATWGEGYYTELFPDLVSRLVPGTPYVEGSPFSFDRYLHPNEDTSGCMHIWDVWNTADYVTYRTYQPRFVSEFGFQGPPAWSTLESVVRDEPRSPYGPQTLSHQKAVDGNLKLERGLGQHLRQPADYVDWHWATQLNQARAIRFGIEHFRSLAPFNTGSVVWQLNDCWPVISWSAVDDSGIRKPLWFALRAAFQPRLATFQPREASTALVLHNDSDEAWLTTVSLRRSEFSGRCLAADEQQVSVPARGSVTVQLPDELVTTDAPARELLVADLGTGERAVWYFAEDPELDLAHNALEAHADVLDGVVVVRVTARSLVKDLMLLVDHADPAARVDDGLRTLLAGETATFRVSAPASVDPAALLVRPVLRTANDLARAGSPAERLHRLGDGVVADLSSPSSEVDGRVGA